MELVSLGLELDQMNQKMDDTTGVVGVMNANVNRVGNITGTGNALSKEARSL